jgi:FMN phosphatase YigB (HAD superfamily)
MATAFIAWPIGCEPWSRVRGPWECAVLREGRAVIFDMDDTLYPYRHHRLEAFKALAAFLAREHGCDAGTIERHLMRATRDDDRGAEVQACLQAVGLPAALLDECLEIMGAHQPDLQLPVSSARVLTSLRRSGWKVGVLTNGPKAMQERKVRALRLDERVDVVVYATNCGTGRGKPDVEPFHEVVRQLGVSCSAAVVVGDDERCDVGGALAAGLQAIRCCAWVVGEPTTRAAAVVNRLSRVPDVAHTLLEEVLSRHAA